MFEGTEEKSSKEAYKSMSPFQRELDLITASFEGACGRVKQAISSEETTFLGVKTSQRSATELEIMSSFAFGAGLRVMSEAGGPWRGVAKVALAAGVVGLGHDALTRIEKAADAAHQTWISPDNHEKSRKTVAENIGAAFFDYPVMLGYGGLGSRLPELGMKFDSVGAQKGFTALSRALYESPLTARLQSFGDRFDLSRFNPLRETTRTWNAQPASSPQMEGSAAAAQKAMHSPKEVGAATSESAVSRAEPIGSERSKPDPSIYLEAAAKFSLPPEYRVKFGEYNGEPVQIKVYPPGIAKGVPSSAQMRESTGISLGGFGRKHVIAQPSE